ncbi:transcriptional regulator [Sphaerisporangium krabiense]|uniref:Transcriptional regulator with XRE-family HTH domain n=1 Tax=Sphaerisporangium krabiense TaxID=763782 RepID=A0A7W8Z9N8_9ACTN|nr:helix-turn-helix transcriptional regulator [Sphaerisporangium krabiense]MBB5630057.1 transcriptional regulator with XRE-family HTH domain [Sphaerisporangium krabiense]GII65004.1 transcriptional regulator [Sphaerisporangium krabiense]
MTRMIDIDPSESPRARFAYELRRHRLAARLTQKQLARRIGFSTSAVAMVETSKFRPSERFAELCDEAFGLDGVVTRLYAEVWPPPPPVPAHFRAWAVEERRATALRFWAPMLVPGMLQTENYARRVLSRLPGATEQEVEQRLSARMLRQAVLSRDDGPVITALIDEGVLHRPVGGPAVMREQLTHLVAMMRHPRVTVQIVPYGAEALSGLNGAYSIAEMRGNPYMVRVESQPWGRTLSERGLIADLVKGFDAIRADAYPQHLSIVMIEETMRGEWT